MRILVIAQHICRPDTAAGDLRLFKLLRSLPSFSSADYLIPERRPPMGHGDLTYWSNLDDIGIRFVDPLFFDRLDIWLEATHYDWIIVEFWHTAERILPTIEQVALRQSKTRLAVDSVDVHFMRELAALSIEKKHDNALQQVLDRKSREIAVYSKADLVFAVTVDDARALGCEGIQTPISVMPIMIDQMTRSTISRGDNIVFIGGFNHKPNVDAITWFAKDIFPSVRQCRPHATLNVIGSNPPSEVLELEGLEGIKVVGFVPSIGSWLDEAAVSVAPLRFGAGMKGKVVEALAASVPVVTTSFGAQGLNATSGEHMHIADSPSEFADAVVRCLEDKSAAEIMAQAGQRLILELCSEREVLKKFKDVLSAPVAKISGAREMWHPKSIKAKIIREFLLRRNQLATLKAKIKKYLSGVQKSTRNY